LERSGVNHAENNGQESQVLCNQVQRNAVLLKSMRRFPIYLCLFGALGLVSCGDANIVEEKNDAYTDRYSVDEEAFIFMPELITWISWKLEGQHLS
jgi:hypothetical protein